MGLPPNKKRVLDDASSQESIAENEIEEIVPTCEEEQDESEEDDSDEDDSNDDFYSSPIPLVSGNAAGVLYDTFVLDFDESMDETPMRYRTDSTTPQAAALRNYYAQVVHEHGEQGQKFFAAYFWHAIEEYKPRWAIVEDFESKISGGLKKVAKKIQKGMRQIFQMQGAWEVKNSKTIYTPIDWPSAHVYIMHVLEKG